MEMAVIDDSCRLVTQATKRPRTLLAVKLQQRRQEVANGPHDNETTVYNLCYCSADKVYIPKDTLMIDPIGTRRATKAQEGMITVKLSRAQHSESKFRSLSKQD